MLEMKRTVFEKQQYYEELDDQLMMMMCGFHYHEYQQLELESQQLLQTEVFDTPTTTAHYHDDEFRMINTFMDDPFIFSSSSSTPNSFSLNDPVLPFSFTSSSSSSSSEMFSSQPNDCLDDEFNQNNYPNKRFKQSYDHHDYTTMSDNNCYYNSSLDYSLLNFPYEHSFNSFPVSNSLDFLLPNPPPPPPPPSPVINNGYHDQVLVVEESNANKKSSSSSSSNGAGSVSAQSMAARQRRRRISDKTQELGKLIPGGNKMNTAEMFHAASKYVKFLQAQVGILQAITTSTAPSNSTTTSHDQVQENKDEKAETIIKGNNKDEMLTKLQVLLASPTIQEKLYSEGKCLVPKEFVEILAN